jgi:hypothetical protein
MDPKPSSVTPQFVTALSSSAKGPQCANDLWKNLWNSTEPSRDVAFEVRAYKFVYNINSYVSIADRETQQAFLSTI